MRYWMPVTKDMIEDVEALLKRNTTLQHKFRSQVVPDIEAGLEMGISMSYHKDEIGWLTVKEYERKSLKEYTRVDLFEWLEGKPYKKKSNKTFIVGGVLAVGIVGYILRR